MRIAATAALHTCLCCGQSAAWHSALQYLQQSTTSTAAASSITHCHSNPSKSAHSHSMWYTVRCQPSSAPQVTPSSLDQHHCLTPPSPSPTNPAERAAAAPHHALLSTTAAVHTHLARRQPPHTHACPLTSAWHSLTLARLQQPGYEQQLQPASGAVMLQATSASTRSMALATPIRLIGRTASPLISAAPAAAATATAASRGPA